MEYKYECIVACHTIPLYLIYWQSRRKIKREKRKTEQYHKSTNRSQVFKKAPYNPDTQIVVQNCKSVILVHLRKRRPLSELVVCC